MKKINARYDFKSLCLRLQYKGDCMVFGMESPTKIPIYKCYRFFDQIGCICKEESPWR